MTPNDRQWVQRIAGFLSGPVLELGVGYGGQTCKEIIEATGHAYYGTDLEKTQAVDFVADFERAEDMRVFSGVAPFGAVMALNVVEHVFDPIRILDNAVSLIRPGGSLVLVGPAIWALHDYPMDVWRVLPNFFEQYAKRRGLTLRRETFEYVGHGPVDAFRNGDSSYRFPPPCRGRLHSVWSRAIHKAFNTYGRGMAQPSTLGIAAILDKH